MTDKAVEQINWEDVFREAFFMNELSHEITAAFRKGHNLKGRKIDERQLYEFIKKYRENIKSLLNKDLAVENLEASDKATIEPSCDAPFRVPNNIEHDIVDSIMNCQLVEFDEPLTEAEKKKMLDFILETFIMRPLLWYHKQMELKKGIEAMVVEDESKESFIISFKTVDEWKKHTSLLNSDKNVQVSDTTDAK